MAELTKPTVHLKKTQSVRTLLITLAQSQLLVMARDHAPTMEPTNLVTHAEEATNSLIFTTLANKFENSNFRPIDFFGESNFSVNRIFR